MRVQFKYYNHKGEIEERDVDIVTLAYDPSFHPEWGYQPGWFINGFDYSRGRDGTQYRSFSLERVILPDDLKQTFKLFEFPREKQEDKR